MKKNIYTILAVFLCIIVLSTLLYYLLNVDNGKSSTVDYDMARPSFMRGVIYDNKMIALVMDEPHNKLLLDIAKAKISKNIKLEQYLDNNFQINNFYNSISDKNNGYVILGENYGALEKNTINNELELNDLSDIIFFENTYNRVYKNSPASFYKFIGKSDPITRNGIDGIEKEFNNILFASNSSELNSLQLTVSYDIIQSLAKKFSSYKNNINIVAFDINSGGLLGFYSNKDNDSSDSSLDKLLNFPKIFDTRIFDSIKVVAMLEKDPTLIEEFHCDGKSCTGKHGLVNLSNIIECPAALNNLSKNNYKITDLAEIVSKFNVYTKDLTGLYSLGLLAYSNDYIPQINYVIKSINANGEENYFKKGEPYKVKLSQNSINFLRHALSIQSKEIKIIKQSNYLVIVYEQGGVESGILEEVNKTFSLY